MNTLLLFDRIRRPALVLLALGAFTFTLVSCKGHPITEIPEGEQTLTGVLLPVPISLSRRGTHALLQNGEEVSLVESSAVNLRQIEGIDVVVTGHFERNTDPDALPVLVASGVTLVNLQMRTWPLPAQGISLETPTSWSPTYFPDGVQFSQTGSNVFLAVSTGALSPLPATGRMTVGGRPAALVTSSGAQTLYVHNGSSMLQMEFAASIAGGDTLVMRIIRSVRFAGPSSASSAPRTGTGSATSSVTGIPCGGAAGVLCPSGQYCEITDSATNIGRCRTVQR
jgi:hypothetical protein